MTVEKAIEILSDVGDINRCCAEDAEALDMAIQALERQQSDDCISRKEVIDIINFEDKWLLDAKSHNEDTRIVFSGLMSKVKALPSVTPTRPTGKWIDIGDEGLVFKCSICGTKKTIESHFCPNCGTRLEVEDER